MLSSRAFRPLLVFGANTNVGKTLITAGLVRTRLSSAPAASATHYIKPLQAGRPSDESFLQRHLSPSFAGNASTLFNYTDHAVSPHLASLRSPNMPNVTDEDVLSTLKSKLQRLYDPSRSVAVYIETAGGPLSPSQSYDPRRSSPAAPRSLLTPPTLHSSSATASSSHVYSLQADLYAPLNLPCILVGDSNLGGINSTLSSLESLTLRGYTVAALAFLSSPESSPLGNSSAVKDYLSRRLSPLHFGDGTRFSSSSIFDIPAPPPPPPDGSPDDLSSYYSRPDVHSALSSLEAHLAADHEARQERLEGLGARGEAAFWWPFTQHKAQEGKGTEGGKRRRGITVIDAARGNDFHVLEEVPPSPSSSSSSSSPLHPPSKVFSKRALFDGCASWWSQGLGHGDPGLALTMAAGAGRYGHVMFPDNVHSPGVELCEKLVGSATGEGNCSGGRSSSPASPQHRAAVAQPWGKKVFLSDDGSTAMEVALKMALRTYMTRRSQSFSSSSPPPPPSCYKVLAQSGCYHGDTLGVMDVAEPSVFNEGQTPWYTSRGLMLSTPTVAFVGGEGRILLHEGEGENPVDGRHAGRIRDSAKNQTASHLSFDKISDIMNVEKRLKTNNTLYTSYRSAIERAWDEYESEPAIPNAPHRNIVSCLSIEPLFIGAGGMNFPDPLYQRALVDVSRSRGVPVVYDEVASGLYRLGVRSCASVIGADPDISSYAKLLGGGVCPIAATVTTSEVFNAFLGDEKKDALLHGHSYTGNVVGCLAGIKALEAFEAYREMELLDKTPTMSDSGVVDGGKVMLHKFDEGDVRRLSSLPGVASAFTLGTVIAVRLHSVAGNGYASGEAASVPCVMRLREKGVFARPLGNVVYLMSSPMTSKAECADILAKLAQSIKEGYTATSSQTSPSPSKKQEYGLP